MKGAREAIEKGFQDAGSEIEDLAKKLELTEKINKVLIGLRVFRGLIKAANKNEEALSKNLPVDYLEPIILSFRTGIACWVKWCRRDEDNTIGIVGSILGGIGRLSTGLVEVLTKPEIAPKVAEALQSVDEAQAIFKKQEEFMARKIELVVVWKDVVQMVQNDVFNIELSDREEGEHYFELYEEVEEIIEDDDTKNIYEAFEGLKDAAQTYLDQVKESCLA